MSSTNEQMISAKKIPALGRPFDLGMLYDRRSDKLILGKTLWSSEQLNKVVNTVHQQHTNSEIFPEDTFDDKANVLGMDGNLKLSFLSGLANVQGAAQFLNDRKTSNLQSRVLLKYQTTTVLKQLSMGHLKSEMVQYPEVFDQDIATDVVVGILYGTAAFMIFEKDISKNESLKEACRHMEVVVKDLPGISVDEKGFIDVTEEQKKNIEKLRCKIYGDFISEEKPTKYEDAVKIYKRLPSLTGDNGENAVPIEVYLCPLSEIRSQHPRMVREISDSFVSKTCAIQEYLQSLEAECNDLMREDVCSRFPTIKKQLSSFRNQISQYKTFFHKKLHSLLPIIRGGGAEESELGDFLKDQECSPFAHFHMDTWIADKKKEMKKLQGMVSFLQETPFICPEDVEKEIYDPSNEHVVCCTFRIGAEKDAQLSSMDKFLNGNDEPELNTNTSARKDNRNLSKKMREAVKQFVELKAANEDNIEVKFLATDETLCGVSSESDGSLGAFIYLYEDGEVVSNDFTSSSKPSRLEVKNVGHDTVDLWWSDSNSNKSNIARYKVQYKPSTETSTEWITQYAECSNEVKQTATISGLQAATNYSFRVCAVAQIVVSQYSEVISATTKPTSPPGKPKSIAATADTITIVFTKPSFVGNGVNIENYKIEWIKDDQWMEENSRYTEDGCLTHTVEGLQQGVSYQFRVTAICGSAGPSEASSLSEKVTTTLPQTESQTYKILGLCDLVETPEDGKPAVYTLPLSLVCEDSESHLRKFEINLDDVKTTPLARFSGSPEKVIMAVGSTGSGKTTTLNAMVNHILGVDWKDDFRFKMIHELYNNQGMETIGNQAHSQTQFVSCYTIPHIEGFRVPYTLTVVDTPGFGDTRGIEQDKVVTKQIRTFFNTKGPAGIDHVDAICFLVQAGNPRLTPTQQYVFDSILSMFGKDIKENISVLFTFADGDKPQALSAMLEAGILLDNSHYFKFNNSALFVDNSGEDDDENFGRMFWKMGRKSFEKFFRGLASMEPKSLVLTKQVLNERAQLEVSVSGLRNKINLGVNTLSRLQQEERIFNQHAADINANRNFKYTVQEEKRVQVKLNIGTYTTNCLTCNYTCHYPCNIPKNEDKARCAAMSNGCCKQCPNKCQWTRHVNDQYRYETNYEDVEKEYNDIKDRYNTALQGQNQVEVVIKQLQEEFDETQQIVLNFVAEMHRGLQKLSEIALKKDPLQQVDYLDLLIESEKSQARPGWKDRVESLRKTRDTAEEINRLAKPGYDPWKEYRENEKTRHFVVKHTPKTKPGFLGRAYEKVKSAFS